MAPFFRTMDEIFRPRSLSRLRETADIVWGRDGPMPAEHFREAVRDATAVVFGTWSYGDAIAEAGSGLRAVLEVAGGHSHHGIGYELCLERGIEVGSAAPAFGPAVAELALGLTLAATRGIAANDRGFRDASERWLHEGNEGYDTLYARQVGFVGCGGLSEALQRLLEPFDVFLSGFDPHIEPAALVERGIESIELSEMFDRCDVIYILAAHTADSAGLITRQLLERLEPAQTLVVMSRAALVDFEALTELAVDEHFRLSVDVYPTEPLPVDHPLRQAPGVVLSSHRAGAVPSALLTIGDMVVEDLEAIVTGRTERRLQYLTPARMQGLLKPAP